MKLTLTRTRLLTFLFMIAVVLKIMSLLLSGHGHPLTDKILSGLTLDLLLLRLIILVHGAYGRYQQLRQQYPLQDFPELLSAALLPLIRNDKVCRVLVTETTLVYYAIFRWKKQASTPAFSWYSRQGAAAVYGIFIFLLLLEMTGMGLLLSRLNYPVLHRVMLAAGAYSVVFLLAHLKAICYRPVQLDDNGILLRYGIITSLHIPFDQVRAVRDLRRLPPADNTVLQLSLLKAIEPGNVALELKQPISLYLLFKQKKAVKQFIFRLDAPASFRKALESRITC